MDLLELTDDPEIGDDVLLYRRVSWTQIGGIERFAVGEKMRLSANCLQDYSEERAKGLGYAGPCMSVGLGSVIADLGFEPEQAMLADYPDYGLVAFSVADVRSLHRKDGTAAPQGVMASPTTREPWHAVIYDRETGKRSKAVMDQLLMRAVWIRQLERPPP